MSKFKKYGKLILFDSLAAICFVGVALFGWLPGPGGIPLLILGLSFLAVNHTWAERWMETVKVKGMSLKNYLFPQKPSVQMFYDIGSIAVMLGAAAVLVTAANRIVSGIGVFLLCFGLAIFIFNRDRIDKIAAFFKRKP